MRLPTKKELKQDLSILVDMVIILTCFFVIALIIYTIHKL